jgi:hypothetical protein
VTTTTRYQVRGRSDWSSNNWTNAPTRLSPCCFLLTACLVQRRESNSLMPYNQGNPGSTWLHFCAYPQRPFGRSIGPALVKSLFKEHTCSSTLYIVLCCRCRHQLVRRWGACFSNTLSFTANKLYSMVKFISSQALFKSVQLAIWFLTVAVLP